MARASLRENILESAVEEFHRLGYNGCSVEDITRHAGVPKGSFYSHFKSKEELAVQVIEAYLEAAPHGVLSNTALTSLKRLKQHFSLLIKPFAESGYEKGCLLGNFSNEIADHSALVRGKLREAFARWAALLSQAIRDGQESGEISTAHKPETWASLLLSSYEGALLRTRVTKDPSALREFETITLRLIGRVSGRNPRLAE
jgi:TetR/AcrR family transcriptional regulator, transcriptional repressor for nem operon